MTTINYPRYVLALVAVFIFTFAYEFVLNHHLLMPMYQATASLWRPMEEMSIPCLLIRQALLSLTLVSLYACYGPSGSLRRTLGFGFWIGLLMAVIEGGSYIWLPIPQNLAIGWFAGALVYGVVATLLMGAVYKAR